LLPVRLQLTLLPPDLSSLSSVRAFAAAVKSAYGVPDILVNNAGFAQRMPITKDGLESGFGSMHIGHFLLTDLFLQAAPADNAAAVARTKNVHVVNIASGLHRLCLMKDCFDDAFLKHGLYTAYHDGNYERAKLANVLHAWRIPNRYADATAVSIDLGWVSTSIQVRTLPSSSSLFALN
jgi:retinol dehydrogenase-13